MQVLKSRNGLTILFKHVPGELVSLRYFVRCGAINEVRPEEDGLSHALEHMLFAGTTNRSWDDIASEYRLCGAESNAETSFEYTNYFATCPAQGFEQAFALTADVVYNATLPADRWEDVEKKAIVTEILMSWDDPVWSLHEKTRRHALGQSYHSPVGSVKAIRQSRVENLQQMRNLYYTGRNVFAVVSGDLEAKQVLRIVNKYDRWSSQTPSKPAQIEIGWNSQNISWKKPELNQTMLLLIKPWSKPQTHRDFFRHRLLLEIFQEYLMCVLREMHGLCYSVEVSIFDDLPQGDFLEIFTSGEPGTSRQLLAALKEAVQKFPHEGIDKITLAQARMSALREILQAESSVSAITEVLGRHWLEGKRVDPFLSMRNGLDSVSIHGLRNLAAEQLTGEYKLGSFKP